MSFWERLFGQQPAPSVYLYSRQGSTFRGVLVAVHKDSFELGACSVAPDGSEQFKPVMGRVIVPRENTEFYTIRS